MPTSLKITKCNGKYLRCALKVNLSMGFAATAVRTYTHTHAALQIAVHMA